MAARESSKERRAREIAITGDLDECEGEVVARLLDLDDGSDCTLFIDSGGGRVYSALAVMSLLMLKDLRATAVVLGACSSATLLVFAACHQRLAMPYSVFQFHPVRWESGENVERVEAAEWSRHFTWLEQQADELLARLLGTELEQIQTWSRTSRYLSGREMADAGLVELIDPTKGARLVTLSASSTSRRLTRAARGQTGQAEL
jgi:ATP-dependent protease ClpP protease subunit